MASRVQGLAAFLLLVLASTALLLQNHVHLSSSSASQERDDDGALPLRRQLAQPVPQALLQLAAQQPASVPQGAPFWRYKVVSDDHFRPAYTTAPPPVPPAEGSVAAGAAPLPPLNASAPILRATHFFSSFNPLNFWSGLEFDKLDEGE